MANELQPMNLSRQEQFTLIGIYVAIAVLSRILPHIANMTAMTSLCVIAGVQFSKFKAFICVLLSLIIADVMLAYLFHYPVWGSWSLFNDAAFVATALLAKHFVADKKSALWIYLFSASIIFWLWTNFGTWITTQLYPHNFAGLFTCYVAALPFLRNALCGDLLWMLIILSVYYFAFLPGLKRKLI